MILLERHGLSAALPRLALGTLQALRRLAWRVTTSHTVGSRAICLTNAGRLVLVRHSYVRGWFLPGGGPRAGETPATALLRELREEIGLRAHAGLEEAFTVDQRADHKRDRQTIWVVHSVRLAPRLSLEIEAIGLFDPCDLPVDAHPSTRYKVARWLAGGRQEGADGDDRDWRTVPPPPEG